MSPKVVNDRHNLAHISDVRKGKGRARNDNDELEDEDAGDSRQIKRQRRVTHSFEEDEKLKMKGQGFLTEFY